MTLSIYRTALVTGASSGIGAAIVRALTERGLSVIAAARRKDRLDTLAEQTGCQVCALDLTDTDAIYAAFEGLEIDVLVNNAGTGVGFDGLLAASRHDVQASLQLNLEAVVHLVRATLPGMIERRRGHLVHIGSIAGLYPLRSALYGATKGGVHLLSQNLRLELLGTGVRNTEICPGRVRTEFFEHALKDEEARSGVFEALQVLEPEDVAEAVVYALDAPWRVNVGLIELTPTEQAVGGVAIERVR